MPPNTVKVDRTTRWGNPFVVGVDGDAQQCVAMFGAMLRGEIATHRPELRETQRRYQSLLVHELHELRGRNLACWCAIAVPCGPAAGDRERADVVARHSSAYRLPSALPT